MIRYSILKSIRYLIFSSTSCRYLTKNNELIIKNFDRKTFDNLSLRRMKMFNNNKNEMLNHIQQNLELILKTSSINNYLKNLNKISLENKLTIEQFNDILFYSYENNIKLNYLIEYLIKHHLLPINKISDINIFIEIIYLFVLHQQKYYDYQTKNSNKILEAFIYNLEINLTNKQINNLSLNQLSLLCSSMYRLQISLKNLYLLQYIGQYLIDDEKRKLLSAVDKQNFIKILTLSNYGKIPVGQALVNRFNQSFEQHMKTNLNTFSYEIVRMTMRIGIYLSMFHFYSNEFFQNCFKLIEFESNSSKPIYRAKDIIQIMNTLIYMGYIKKSNMQYLNLLNIYEQMKQFDQKPERLVDVLAPLAMIGCFPEKFLEEIFTKENLNRLTESRLKEKLFFISQSYKILCSPQRSYLDQNYLDTLPHHLFGSWKIEKQKRPYFSIVIQRLLECVPNHFYVKSAFILKHFKSPDIIIRLNTEQKPQILSNENENECSMYALEVLSEDELCINEPFRPLGLFYSKAQQLKKLKYIPVIIYPHDSLHKIKTTEEVFKWIVERAKTTELLLLNEN